MKHDCIFTIRLLMLRPIMTQTNYPSSPFPPPPIHQSKNRKQHIAYLFCSDLSTRNSFTPPLSPHISRSTSSLLVSLTATTLTEAALMHLPPLIPIHPLTPKKNRYPSRLHTRSVHLGPTRNIYSTSSPPQSQLLS